MTHRRCPTSPRRARAGRARTDRARTDQARRLALLALGSALVPWAVACRIERAAAPGVEDPEVELASQVESILRLSAEAWNAGDLDGFMVHYYIGGGGLRVGYDAIRERYAPDFEPGAARDSLRFESIRTRRLDQRFGIATARYVLHRDGATTSAGPFTLVLMQVEGAWKIIHDQSAADPAPARESAAEAADREEDEGGATGAV
jgi:hypothetical protein